MIIIDEVFKTFISTKQYEIPKICTWGLIMYLEVKSCTWRSNHALGGRIMHLGANHVFSFVESLETKKNLKNP